MSAPWLSVVGIGEDGLEGLTPAARRVLDGAELLVGGARHLAMIPPDPRPRWPWPKPLTDAIPRILEWRGRPVCVLASGNPQFYGIGVILGRQIPHAEMSVLPAPSAFSLACARLGWSQADCDLVTLHGRPLETLHAHLAPGRRILVLSADGSTPGAVAELLRARGYGGSTLTVLERMGGREERQLESTAESWSRNDVADLNVVAIDCVADVDAPLLPRVPGLPDDSFSHDGMFTKREVRAATLAALAPLPGQLLWDVGAGSGSVAIEWMRAAPQARAIAVDHHTERLAQLRANAKALGAPDLKVVEGTAPAALADLEAPHAIFVGGGLATDGLAEQCWDSLRPGGRLVANAVTLESEQRLAQLHNRYGGEMVRIAISRLKPVGPFQGWSPLMPVTQWAAVKPQI